MEYFIEQLPVQPIVYMRRTGAYGIENYNLMMSLKEWATQKGLLENGTIYGIAHDNESTPPEQCRYDVCLVATPEFPIDEAVQRGQINSGTYAVFTILHTAEAVHAFWASIMRMLQENDLKYDTAKPILECYKHKLVEEGKCEFCVPLVN